MRTFLEFYGCNTRQLTRVHAGGKKNPEHKRKKSGRKPLRKREAQRHKPAPLPAVTAPPAITTSKVLQVSLPALDPWWNTFVGHSLGVWAGKCGAFNMADSSLEPMTIEGDNIEVKELHTRVMEMVGSSLPQMLSYVAHRFMDRCAALCMTRKPEEVWCRPSIHAS